MSDEGINGLFQFFDGAVNASPQLHFDERCDAALDQMALFARCNTQYLVDLGRTHRSLPSRTIPAKRWCEPCFRFRLTRTSRSFKLSSICAVNGILPRVGKLGFFLYNPKPSFHRRVQPWHEFSATIR
jgi:hypothetical protein